MMFGYSKKCDGDEREAVRDHVEQCDGCHVRSDGSVIYCRQAERIIQRFRKQKFFGK